MDENSDELAAEHTMGVLEIFSLLTWKQTCKV